MTGGWQGNQVSMVDFSARTAVWDSRRSTILLVLLVGVVSYLAPALVAASLLYPQAVWPLWPGCAILVSVLVVTRKKIWPALILSAFAGFVTYDLRAGVPISSIKWFILADTLQALIAAFGVRYCFQGPPRLENAGALVKYAFFAVILAPFAAAFVSAPGIPYNYWTSWRISFLSEVLAFLTIAPLILSWTIQGPAFLRRPAAHRVEAAVIFAGTILVAFIVLASPARSASAALLYSLLPFLLWSALRFGWTGISTSIAAITLLSIWGLVHGRGPFAGPDPHSSMLSLQIFLIFASTTFLALAALAEGQKIAEEAISSSEKRYRRMVETTIEGIWLLDSNLRNAYVNPQMERMLGYDPGEMLHRSVLEFYFPEDVEQKKEGLDRRRRGLRERFEERLKKKDGSELWVRMAAIPVFKETGEFDGAFAMVEDITERKQNERELSSMSGRLIDAQEQERSRIASELHDDIGQRIALLAIELDQLQKKFPGLPTEVCQRIAKSSSQTSEIASDLHSLSHELASSKLEYLGLASAAKSFCKEFGERQGLEIEFKSHNLPSTLESDVSVCFFRVLQEALRNAVKHSGVRHFDVELWGDSDEIHLQVKDLGRGFDIATAKQGSGLGLVSMRERLRLLNGTLSIHTQPHQGTVVHAYVPVRQAKNYAPAS